LRIVWPDGWPRHELTWWIASSARRRGSAEEASRALVGWASSALGWARVETHMRDDNLAARRLVAKLGRIEIAREPFPDGVGRSVFAFEV
jgi:RimJ/RimL family protein N-acetyltransferase